MKTGILPVALAVVVMTTAGVVGDAGKRSSQGNPLWEELEPEGVSGGHAGRGVDHTDIFKFDPASQTMEKAAKTGQGDQLEQSRLEGCQEELLQCRHNLADLHEKTLISAMYDRSEDHDVIKTCKKELKTCRDDLNDCELGYQVNVPAPVEEDGSSTESPCKLEQMFFRRYAKHFISLLIGENGDGEPDGSPLGADVRLELTAYNWRRLRQFVRQKGKVRLIDAHDLLTDMLVSVHRDNSTSSIGWLHKLTGMETTDITFYALLCLLSIVVVVFEARTNASWWQQFCAVMFALFMISLAWNWVSLYKREFAGKMSAMLTRNAEMPAACNPDKMTWWDSLSEAFRQHFSFRDNPCKDYHQAILVDPIYEVPPTRAIAYTISSMFLEPLQQCGKHLANFHRELLKDLPYAAWLPTMLSVYLLPAAALLAMCYCPRWGGRGGGGQEAVAALQRVHRLEAELRERDAIYIQGRRPLEELEVHGRVGYRADQHAPVSAAYIGRDVRQRGAKQPSLASQRQLPQDYPAETTAAERPRSSGKRRVRGSSDSDLLHQQQRQPIYRGHLGRSYQGDVSAGEESSDEMDIGDRQRPCVLPLETRPGGTGAQVHRPRTTAYRGNPPPPHHPPRPKTTEILRQPVESPRSEIDSEKDQAVGGGEAERARSRATGIQKEGSPGQRVGSSGIEPTTMQGASVRRKTPQPSTGPEEEEEAKLRKASEESRPAKLTPASSTDSEPFPASALGCDSPSSVSVIEGDSSPVSAGSVDGDSHLRGLGTSLSGSIDIIEPLGPLDTEAGNPSEDGQDSDEFEVLSREQCQSEEVAH